MKFIIPLTATMCLLIAGCVQTTIASRPSEKAANDNAQVQLAEAATSVSQSLSQLAAIEQAGQPKTTMSAPPSPESIEMQQLASTDWTGPIEPLLQKIATACNYKLHVIGRKPGIPVIVSVYASNKPLANILRDASFQAAKNVNVMVYSQRKIIELRYLNT